MNFEMLLFLVTIFLMVIMLVLAGRNYYQQRGSESAKLLRQRIENEQFRTGQSESQTSLLKQRPFSAHPSLNTWLQKQQIAIRLDELLQQTGTSATLDRCIKTQLLIGVFLAILFYLLSGWFALSLIGLVTGALLPILWFRRLKDKRLALIETQLPEALDLMSRALRAGHSFSSALNMVSSEGPLPIATEFRQTFDEINFGLSAQDALVHLAGRVPSTDLRYFVIAVLIQRESGGNLSELLDNLSHIMRERLKLLGSIRTLSAEGKFSAWILTLLPFGVAFMMQTLTPGFLSILWTDEMGIRLLIGAGIAMLLGIFWMSQSVKIRV